MKVLSSDFEKNASEIFKKLEESGERGFVIVNDAGEERAYISVGWPAKNWKERYKVDPEYRKKWHEEAKKEWFDYGRDADYRVLSGLASIVDLLDSEGRKEFAQALEHATVAEIQELVELLKETK